MGDVFMERMVKKKFESTDALVLLGIIVAMVVVVFIGFIVGFVLMPMPMITFLVVIGAGFGGYKLLTMRLLEYEYSLTNGYVAVDKIMNRVFDPDEEMQEAIKRFIPKTLKWEKFGRG